MSNRTVFQQRRRRAYAVLFAATFLVLAVGFTAEALVYTDISLHYYNEFFKKQADEWNTRNFMRYHVLRQGYSTDQLDVSFNFNLFEDVNGPMADHSITPYTIESVWNMDANRRLKNDLLVLVDVYNKDQSYMTSMFATRYCITYNMGRYQLDLIPGIQVRHDDTLEIRPNFGASLTCNLGAGRLKLAINDLDVKDSLLLGDGDTVLTALLHWPTWGKNDMSVGANVALGERAPDQQRVWLDFRVYFDHWFAYETR